jgi:hypothetical protein
LRVHPRHRAGSRERLLGEHLQKKEGGGSIKAFEYFFVFFSFTVIRITSIN